MAVIKQQRSSGSGTVIANESSLANNTMVVAAADFDNTIGATGDGSLFGECEAVFIYATSPTLNSAITCWFLRNIDGTNREDGSSSVLPGRAPDVSFRVRAVTTSQRLIIPCPLPPGPFRVLTRNEGTNQTITTFVLTLRPHTIITV
jgi:hypothetical protein